MGRQRFLHHYLPAHIASCLVTGSIVEFLFNVEPINVDDLSDSARQRRRLGGVKARMGPRSLMAAWAATVAILSAVTWGFAFFAPLTYGTPGLDVASVKARQWLNYDLHFAK